MATCVYRHTNTCRPSVTIQVGHLAMRDSLSQLPICCKVLDSTHKRYHLNPQVVKQTAAQHTAFFIASLAKRPSQQRCTRLPALASTGACGSLQPIKGMSGPLRVHRCTLRSSLAAAVLRSAQLYAGTAACWRNVACLAFIYRNAVAALSVVHALH